MISQYYRFLGRGSLQYLFRRGRTIGQSTDPLRLRWVVNRRRQSPRLAVIVSKKVSKKAVVRNRIRRRCFEFWRSQLPDLPPTDLALVATQAELADWPAPRLAELNQKLLEQLKALLADLAD